MTIMSKSQMFRLYEAGEFGNKLRSWKGVDAYLASGFTGMVGMRYRGGEPGKWCAYNLPRTKIPGLARKWCQEGAEVNRIIVSEAAPDHRLYMQGEFCADNAMGYYLFYSTAPLPMREALKTGRHCYGPSALMVAISRMTPASEDEFRALLERFPSAVIEFSVYHHCLGSSPRCNTLFWEVRNY